MTLLAKGVAYSVGIFLFTCFISRCDSQCPHGYSGSPCKVIQCPLLLVKNADPPTGSCSPASVGSLVYKTSCTFHCDYHYELKGSKVRVCQLDGTWSGTATSCEMIHCPKLPPVFGAEVFPFHCLNGPVTADTVCGYRCAPGYHVDGLPSDISWRHLICKTDKTWDAPVPKCHDFEPPILRNCPNVLTTSTLKGKATGKVFWNVEVTDNSLSVDPDAKINVRSSHLPSQELPIGSNTIKVYANDSAGNVATCTFTIEVRDTEPPTCSFCPADIVQEGTKSTVKVDWKRPVCSDNSGKPISILSNVQSGAIFSVPSTYQVHYNVIDESYNENKNCSFKLTLKVKSCPRFPPPRNGALACITLRNSETCAVMCETETDYEDNPAWLYFCSDGQWQMFSVFPHSRNMPWPNCSATANQSFIQMMKFPDFFYNGEDPNFQDTIKMKFLDLLKSRYIPPSFCPTKQCTKDNISVFVGAKG